MNSNVQSDRAFTAPQGTVIADLIKLQPALSNTDALLAQELLEVEKLSLEEIGGEVTNFHRDAGLKVLAMTNLANEALDLACRAGARLIAAKEQLPHGRFIPWANQYCPALSLVTRHRYMTLARNYSRVKNLLPGTSLRKAYQLVTAPKATEKKLPFCPTRDEEIETMRHLMINLNRSFSKFKITRLTFEQNQALQKALGTYELKAERLRARLEERRRELWLYPFEPGVFLFLMF